MRIALVTESFYPAVDGATTTVRAITDRLVEIGHAVQVMASGPGLATYRGCPVARVRSRDQVGDALAGFRPDVTVVAAPGRIGRRALDRSARLGVPTVELTATNGSPGGWRPGVDTDAFSPALRDPALHRTWSRGGRLVVVGYAGSSPRRDNHVLAELTRVANIRPVRVATLPTGDLAPLLASLDLFVDARPDETCGHLLRQAGASGIPVVAPRSGGATSVVRPLETGLLHDPTAPHALARAVAALAGDSRRGLLGERAREVAHERDWRTAVDELVRERLEPLLGVPAGAVA